MTTSPPRLRHLATWIDPFDDGTPAGDVSSVVRRAGHQTVVIRRGDRSVAAISAADLFMSLTGPLGFGWPLQAERPIGDLVTDIDPVNADDRVVDFGQQLLDAGGFGRTEQVVVRDGERLGLVDISDVLVATGHRLRNHSAELRVLAGTDSLTGTLNRRGLREELRDRATTELGPDEELAVIFIDIDRFKLVNDAYGHAAGDEVLREFARRIESTLARGDVIGRLAGDEFVVISSGTRAVEAAVTTGRRIADISASTFRVGPHEIALSASVGVTGAGPGHDVDAVLRKADMAMYEAKRTGRGRVHVLEPSEHNSLIRAATLEARLPGAIADGVIVPHYQPIFRLADHDIVGFEALARWPHDGAFVPPGEFVPIVERAGLMPDMTTLMLNAAARDLPHLRAGHGPDVSVSVNTSARHAATRTFTADVDAALGRFDVPSGGLSVEITEAVEFADTDALRSTVDELRAMGVRVLLDDFGTGYASLSEVTDLPFNAIKVDRGLVVRAHTSDLIRTVLRGVYEFARNAGIETVAEGLETDRDVDLVRLLGSGLGQGHVVSPARPLEQLVAGRAASV